MKTLFNLDTTIKIRVDEQEVDPKNAKFADLIKIVIDQPQQGGFSYDDIENRIAISSALKTVNGTIELEDAQFKYLLSLVERMHWPFFHEDLLTFKKEITALK